jgi:hypothetical protein
MPWTVDNKGKIAYEPDRAIPARSGDLLWPIEGRIGKGRVLPYRVFGKDKHEALNRLLPFLAFLARYKHDQPEHRREPGPEVIELLGREGYAV